MTTYSPESQMNFSIQWFKGWSDFQKDDFVSILAQKIGGPNSTGAAAVNGLVNGMTQLDTSSGRPPSLFSCQVKLFNEWWDSWSESDKDKMKDLIKEADSKFWETLEEEMNGTRCKLDEDFMIVTCSEESNNDGTGGENGTKKVGSGDAPAPPPVFKVKQIVTGSSIIAASSGTNDTDEDVSNTIDETVRDGDDDHTIISSTNGDTNNGIEKNGHESPTSPVATEI